MRPFLLALLFASGAAAQNARVVGRAITYSGEPVPDVTVALGETDPKNGPLTANYLKTDSDGGFVFDVHPGGWMLGLDKEGFLAEGHIQHLTMPLRLAAGDVRNFTFRFTPKGIISGRVVDSDGKPLNTDLVVWTYAYVQNRLQLARVLNERSDSQGNFHGRVPPGRYYISAAQSLPHESGPSVGGLAREEPVRTYYPSALAIHDATPLDLGAGEELLGIDIRMRKQPLYSLRGRAVDTAAGAAWTRGVYLKNDRNQGILPISKIASDGRFEVLNLPPGTYILEAQPTRPNGPVGRVVVKITGSDVDGVVLPIGPGSEIAGSIKSEDGSGNHAEITLTDMETNVVIGGHSTSEVRFPILVPGKYSVSVKAGNLAYVSSVRFNGQDITAAPELDLSRVTSGTLDVLVSSKGAGVEGIVKYRSGEPALNTLICIWPKLPQPVNAYEGLQTVTTGLAGEFGFSQNLQPGDYYVAAWEEIDPALARSIDFVARLRDDAQLITLKEGSHAALELIPVERERIAAEASRLLNEHKPD